jgi:hypothetical protein
LGDDDEDRDFDLGEWPMPFAGPLLVLLAGMLGVALVPLLFVG